MAEQDIAALLNRPDLSIAVGWSADAAVDQYGGTIGTAMPGFVSSGNGIGQVSLGVLALITLGLVGFYVWTRSHQR
jgi:hypothetical protein